MRPAPVLMCQSERGFLLCFHPSLFPLILPDPLRVLFPGVPSEGLPACIALLLPPGGPALFDSPFSVCNDGVTEAASLPSAPTAPLRGGCRGLLVVCIHC